MNVPASPSNPPYDSGDTTWPAPTAIHSTPPPHEPSLAWFWCVLAMAALVYAILWIINDKTRMIAVAGIEVLPLLPLAVLAHLGHRRVPARVGTVSYWGLFAALGTFSMVSNCVLAAADLKYMFGLMESPGQGLALQQLFPHGVGKALLSSAIVCAGTFVGFLCFFPVGRALFVRRLTRDADSFTQTTAVATLLPLLVWCVAPVTVFGEQPLQIILKKMPSSPGAESLLSGIDIVGLAYYRTAWALPCALIAAGFPITRTLRGAIDRMGLAVPSAGQFAFAVGLGVVLAPVGLGLSKWLEALFQSRGWPGTESSGVDELLKAATPALAIAIGVTAGVTEEICFRGLLQPRIGLLFANLLFASIHLQYSWDGLIAVFFIGFVLGLLRRYTNTTCCIIVHGLYDFLLIMTYLYRWQWPIVGGT